MSHSVHLETTSSYSSVKTSDHNGLTDIGYEILQIIEELASKDDPFALTPKKIDIANISKIYHAAHPDKSKDPMKSTVTAEIRAFINMGMIEEKTGAGNVFKRTPQGEFNLLPKAKERMVAHEKRLAEETAEAERLAQIPPKDPLALTDIHFDVLQATQSYTNEKRPNGATKVYIVGRAVDGDRSLRDDANAAFATLQDQECLVPFRQFEHEQLRFTLSARGKQILEDKPAKFPSQSLD